ncbi:MAG TPA: hypothetical protein VJ258_00990 [Candidatus Limnocylindrales bacterium]|jgi:hypothetical protein|nr:hypothetical protein [Candidatus Limnocylindrales bacterium]
MASLRQLGKAFAGMPPLLLLLLVYVVVLVAAITQFGGIAAGQAGATSPAASASAGVSASPAPVAAETLSGRISTINNADEAFLLAVVILGVVIPGAVILFAAAVIRLCRIVLQDQLVLSDVVDGTGFNFKDQVAGLSQVMREGVYRSSIDFRARYPSTDTTRALAKALVPARTSSDDLTAFVGAVKGAAPTQLGSLLAVIPALIPPEGTKVECCLERAAGAPSRLTLSAQISGLAGGSGMVLESVVGRSPGSAVDDLLSQGSGFACEAAQWLTILLIRRRLMGWKPSTAANGTDQRSAECHNLIGVELMRLAGSVRILDPDPLYVMAIEELRDAEASAPTSYRPAQNLADAMSYLGAVRGIPSLQFDSLKQYDQALKLATNAKLGIEVERLIALSRAVTQLCTEDDHEKEESEGVFCRCLNIDALYTGTYWAALRRLYEARQADVLYTAACWSAVHARYVTNKGRKSGTPLNHDICYATKALVYAVDIEQDLAAPACIDPDMSFLSSRGITDRVFQAAGWLSMPERKFEDMDKFAEDVASDGIRA